MANKYTLVASTTTGDRIAYPVNTTANGYLGAMEQSIQLSDGTLVMLYSDGAGSWTLAYSADHTTVNTISTSYAGPGGLCRDASDNLYLAVVTVGANQAELHLYSFKKGTGYSWTLAGIDNLIGTSGLFAGANCIWSTGGTAGYVTVWLPTNLPYQWVFDASALMAAGSGANVAYLNFYNSNTNGLGPILELSSDGFGATSGLYAYVNSSTSVGIASWAVSSAGALTTTALTTVTSGNVSLNRFRLIRAGTNLWALVYPSDGTAGRFKAARFSSTALLTAGVELTPPSGFPSPTGSISWDAFWDSTASKVWVMGWSTATPTTMLRVGCAVGSGVTWDSAAVTDDTAVGTGTNTTIRVVRDPVSTSIDWQTFNQNGSTYALLGDYTQLNLPPNAPLLGPPANGAIIDLAAGTTFRWTFSSPISGNTQSAWAFRIKVSGGAYNYWNAQSSALQSTEVFNSGAAQSVAIPAAVLSDGGTIYNWSVNTRDQTGATGVYAADNTVTGSSAPALSVTAPVATVTTATPLVSWNFTPANSGDTQSTYQVKVESGAYGVAPGSGTAVWDSTEVADAYARSRQVGVSLSNAVTYRFFVRCKESNTVYSSWAYSTATVSFDVPATPALSVAYDATYNRNLLTVTGRDNLLTYNQASLENGNTTGWAVGANCTIAASTAQALNGGYSLSLTSSAAGDMSATTPSGTSGVAVSSGTPYLFLAYLRSAASARNCFVTIQWYDSTGAALTSVNSSVAADSTTGWTPVSGTATAPFNAAYARVGVTVEATGAASEVHYVDQISIAPTPTVTWTRGGLAGATTAAIYASDDAGTTWQYVRTASALYLPALSQTATVYDYEFIPGTSRLYRANVSAPAILSAYSANVSINPTLNSWWVRNPLSPSTQNLALKVTSGHPTTRTQRSAVHYVLGATAPTTVVDVVTGQDGSLTVTVLSNADYLALTAMVKSGQTLYLMSPFNESWYIIGGQPGGGSSTSQKQGTLVPSAAANPVRSISFMYVQVSRPGLP